MSVKEREVELIKQKQKEALRLDFHKFVLSLLQTERKNEILEKANKRVSLWKNNNLCSYFYIEKWDIILNDNLNLFELEIIKNNSNNALALMQNSPFSFLIKEFKIINNKCWLY